MKAQKLLEQHKYTEAITECEEILAINVRDMAATAILASAHMALGQYLEALPLLERVGEHERSSKITPGQTGRQIEISCLHWMLGESERAIGIMQELVRGVLSGSIKYGDAAGGVRQGLLLYYMAVTLQKDSEVSFARDYMMNRARRAAIESWPGPVAQYYLRKANFNELIFAATRAQTLQEAMQLANSKLLVRRRLTSALFHDGVMRRAMKDENGCLARMKQCLSLENPLIELEWYLARYEAERSARTPAKQ